jgi:hypothetical protein
VGQYCNVARMRTSGLTVVGNEESGFSVISETLAIITVKKRWRTQPRTQDPGYEVIANDIISQET